MGPRRVVRWATVAVTPGQLIATYTRRARRLYVAADLADEFSAACRTTGRVTMPSPATCGEGEDSWAGSAIAADRLTSIDPVQAVDRPVGVH